MNIYYFAHQIYQFSYAWPLFNEVGGTFLVRKYKTMVRFKKYLRGSVKSEQSSFMGTPSLIKRNLDDISDLDGVIISQSNSKLHNNPEISRSIFIGHGTGDKNYGKHANRLSGYQYIFVSGPKHLEKLKDAGVEIPEDRLIKIGNMRFDNYVNGKIDRNQLMDRHGIPEKDRSRKTVLYAPTWEWGNGTIKKYAKLFASEITREHNLIIRPHHHDTHSIPKIKLWAKLNGIKRLYFSNPNKLAQSDTMQDFIVSDILISDTSSVLYEYLITGKPIIVASTDFSDLHTMPDNMNVMRIADFYDGKENILKVINRNFDPLKDNSKYTTMLNDCFYFNDGRSVQRAADFVRKVSTELKK